MTPYADHMVTCRCGRNEAFSPVKQAHTSGQKTPHLAKLAVADSLTHSVFSDFYRDMKVNLERGAVSKGVSPLCLLKTNQPTERHTTVGKKSGIRSLISSFAICA